MIPLLHDSTTELYHCDASALARLMSSLGRQVAALIVDAPYSAKTHAGHDAGALTNERALAFAASTEDAARRRYEKKRGAMAKLSYAAWSADDVAEFVSAWSPLTDGWFCSLTDDQLAPAWADALSSSGRLVFSPIACVEPGSRVRMAGDGPAQWSCWLVVARPRSIAYSKWGALPGAYVVPHGFNPRPTTGGKAVVGGKPLWLMESLVRDYSRVNDLVCDPCSGGGTTGIAALRNGRRFIGCDAMDEHAQLSARALSAPRQTSILEALL